MGVRGGIDLGGTKIQAVVVDEQSKVLGQARRPTPRDGRPSGVAAEMSAVLRDAASEAGVEASALAGLGVGSPGAVDEAAGTVEHACNQTGTRPSRSPRRSRETSASSEC